MISDKIVAGFGNLSDIDVDYFIKKVLSLKEKGLSNIKFQYIIPGESGNSGLTENKEFKTTSFSFDQYIQILEQVKALNVFFEISGNDSYKGVLELKKNNSFNIQGIKLEVINFLNFEIIERAGADFNLVFVSINGLTAIEISRLISFLEFKNLKQKVVFTYGIWGNSKGKTEIKINKLVELKKNFGIKILLSNYPDSDSKMDVNLFSMGYDYIEKLINPEGNEELVRQVSQKSELDFLLVTDNVLKLDDKEIEYRNRNKNVITYKTDIPAGTLLSADHIQLSVPQDKENYLDGDKVIGRRLKINATKNQAVASTDLDLVVYGLIYVRASSSRLPGKCFLKVGENETLRFLMKRLKKATRINKLIVCTTVDASDDSIEKIAGEEDIICVRGAENVFSRTNTVFKEHGFPDFFLRLTADNLFPDTRHIDGLIEAVCEGNYDYYRHANVVDGCDFEIISTDYFRSLSTYYTIPEDHSEYMTLYLKSSYAHVLPPKEYDIEFDYLDYRFTLDYAEDLANIRSVFNELKNVYFSYQDLCNLLLKNKSVYTPFAPINKASAIQVIKNVSF